VRAAGLGLVLAEPAAFLLHAFVGSGLRAIRLARSDLDHYQFVVFRIAGVAQCGR
jgi:hypothetical protein